MTGICRGPQTLLAFGKGVALFGLRLLYLYFEQNVKLQKESGGAMENVGPVTRYKMVLPQNVTHIRTSYITAVLLAAGVGKQTNTVNVLNVWTIGTAKV